MDSAEIVYFITAAISKALDMIEGCHKFQILFDIVEMYMHHPAAERTKTSLTYI